MVEFAYNNAKNTSTGHISFKLNYRYHPRISDKKNPNPRLKSKTVKELSSKLQNLIAICQQNLYHTQKLQKQANNKRVKPQSYAPGNMIWLSNKYLKTKRNYKLEAKFFNLFWVLYSISKQAYKLELPKK